MSLGTFAEQALSNFQATAALTPSSPFLVQAMVKPLPLSDAKVVVEFGPGTGAMTRPLLDALPPDALLIAFEVNGNFVRYLKEEFPDPRLKVIPIGAENSGRELQRMGITRVDAVLSSLGFSLMRDPLPDQILEALTPFLDDKSILTQFQYVQRVRFMDGRATRYDVGTLLQRHFKSVQRRLVWWNLPPAFVFDCSL